MTGIAAQVIRTVCVAWGVGAFAASPSIGLVTAKGSFRMDNAAVSGNSTLFAGATVEAGRVPSVLHMDDGVRLLLAAGSRGRVYRDRFVLDRGSGQLENGARYRLEAGDLRIQPSSAGVARVMFSREGKIEVEAISSPVNVTGADGTMLARLDAGSALSFEPQPAGATPPFQVSGCLAKTARLFVLRDETTSVLFEVRGPNLAHYEDQRVEITETNLGRANPATRASEAIQVRRIKAVGGTCVAPAAPSVVTKTGPKTGKRSSGRAGKAIIAGVVVAGAAAGAAVALGEEKERDTISR